MTPRLHFLERTDSLALQVAEVLLEGMTTYPIDLGDTQVWIPTAGAGRRIRFALAQRASQKNTGVLSPVFLQPMQALLPENPELRIATRSEREAAWAKVLRKTPLEELDHLVPHSEVLEDISGLLGAGGMLCDLCDLLVEGGLDPMDSKVAEVCEDDADRWNQLRPLYLKYLRLLQEADRSDPNSLRLQMPAGSGDVMALRRVVVACVPDLPFLAGQYLAALTKQDVQVEILIWKPGTLVAGFDEWGRPLTREWISAPLPISPEQITVARRADNEATTTLDFLAASQRPGDFALALADETLAPAFAAEIMRRGGMPFLPEGKKLADGEAATVALEWENFRIDGDLRVLRNLSQRPHFTRWLGHACDLAPSQILANCDFLISVPLAETLDQARAFLSDNSTIEHGRDATHAPDSIKMIAALENLRGVPISRLLQEAWSGSPWEAEVAGMSQVLDILGELAASPLFADWPAGLETAFLRALRAGRTFDSAPDGSVELVGWLETPWLDGARLAICGCSEGSLPGSVNEHAFLPDSKRKLLGLLDNTKRLARDAYLLNCLLTRTNTDNLRLSFSKFGADGSPSLPSRLLMRCTDENLPARVLQVFGEVQTPRSQPARKNDWLWDLPQTLRKTEITKISPTAFKDYLACPFRYYWKKILHLDAFDPDPREMDAMRFGLLVHNTLEAFGKRAPHEAKANKIEKIVLEQLENEALKALGPSPVAAVRVQLEAIKVRLRAFARVQAAEYAAGWRIVDVEKKFPGDGDIPLHIGPLRLSAQIDRIEEHSELGLRIMDYKTFSKPKTPEKTHFGSASANTFLDEAKVLRNEKDKCWVDLQLPLYRFIAGKYYSAHPVQTAYFVLPADPDSTAVISLELTDEDYHSALHCADAIAERVQRGVFWPPQEHQGNWDDPYAALFLNGRPENCLTSSTIEFLKGRP